MKYAGSLTFGAIVLMLGFAASPLVTAADPAPAPTPVPINKPDFTPMMFLTGTWNCSQMLRGKQRPDTSTTTVAMDGMWMVSQDSAPPFDQYRNVTINATGYMGYDTTIKQWVQIGVDSGGGYGWESSPGWQGNVITWSGKGLDGSTFSDVVTKVSDTETTDANTATDPQGKTTKTAIHCTKTAS
jgi:hypothetical protein